MAWLIAHMWISLSAAAVLGLLFGFAIRGATGAQKIRRAQVERDVAKTELLQTKNELDALFTAHRKLQNNSETPVAPVEIEAPAESQPADIELRERNSWLEERIASLQSDLENTRAVPAAGLAASALAVAGANTGPGADDEIARLRDEVTRLQEQLDGANQSSEPAAEAGDAAEETGAAAGNEEIARLRWRNRYLEGRLAYFEEGETVNQNELAPSADKDEAEDDVAAATSETEVEIETVAAAEAEAEPDEPAETEAVAEADPEPEAETEAEPESEPAAELVAEAETTEAAVEEAVPPEAPDTVSKPKDGGDDLTVISGVGPKIAQYLNGLGIWSYEQIAGWTPANASWIDEQLSFEGRVAREGWIKQAQSLVSAPVEQA